MDRTTLLWTLVVFFGAALVFGTLREATADKPAAVTLGVQAAALALLIAGIVLVVRRLK